MSLFGTERLRAMSALIRLSGTRDMARSRRAPIPSQTAQSAPATVQSPRHLDEVYGEPSEKMLSWLPRKTYANFEKQALFFGSQGRSYLANDAIINCNRIIGAPELTISASLNDRIPVLGQFC